MRYNIFSVVGRLKISCIKCLIYQRFQKQINTHTTNNNTYLSQRLKYSFMLKQQSSCVSLMFRISLNQKKRRNKFLLIHTDRYGHDHAPERKAEDEEIIWGEEWGTPSRLSWAGAQRSSSVPVGPIPTRITTRPVHSDSSALSVYLGSQPHRNPLHPSTLTLLPPLEAPTNPLLSNGARQPLLQTVLR